MKAILATFIPFMVAPTALLLEADEAAEERQARLNRMKDIRRRIDTGPVYLTMADPILATQME